MTTFKFHWLLVFQLVSSTHSYRFQCPDISQRRLRASGYCTNRLRSKYTCLYDTNMLSYFEQCYRNPDFVTPGEKYVISGNLRNVDCSSERYQPFRLWSNVSGECLNQKSMCGGEGQVIFHNGSLVEDRACRCDYTKGYRFIKIPKQNCSCNPSDEDCSCYIKKCPDGSVLSPDYECVEENHNVNWKCPRIEIASGSLQNSKTKRIKDRQKQLNISLIAISAMFLLIIAYTVIVVIFFDKIQTLGNSKDVWCNMLKSRHRSESGPSSITENQETKSSANEPKTIDFIGNDEKNHTLDQDRQFEDIKVQFEKQSKEKESLISQIKIQKDNIKSLELTSGTLSINSNETNNALQEIKDLKNKLVQIQDESKAVTTKLKDIEIKKNSLLRQNTYLLTNLDQKSREVDSANKSNKQNEEIIHTLNKLLEATQQELKNQSHKINSQEQERKQLHNQIQELKGNIRVFCRVRPLLGDETIGNNGIINHMQFPDQEEKIILNENCLTRNKGNSTASKYEPSEFSFDKVFSNKATQPEVYEEISQLVQSVLDGYNVCIFAYGQTGSGKTYTMEGLSVEDNEHMGMIPRAVLQIFESTWQQENIGWKFGLYASVLEIYNEKIRDLLNDVEPESKADIKIFSPNKKCKEVMLPALTVKKVETKDMVFEVLRKASKNRSVETTKRNERSSRGHCVVTLKLNGHKADETIKGTLQLVDLAGSERINDSGSVGQRQNEATAINKSLVQLGIVIRAVGNRDKHVDYRSSKLTQLLQNSLGGNSKTLMFVNVSPQEKCFQETLNSLTFASKVNNCNLGTAQPMTNI